jgi:hypothetical protein
MLKTNDILIAYVGYEESDGEKKRPVLFLEMDGDLFIVFEIRSSYGDDNHQNPSWVQSEYYYKIQDWREAGLRKPSWINTKLEVELTRYDFNNMRLDVIGQLSLRDAEGLEQFLGY